MVDEADTRPDPDALPAATGREGRGRLKIFLGAAPGVGKTFAMLSAASRLARAQLDVVVGVVETHGRAETDALLQGLEILPRRIVTYRGTPLSEFDLDGALQRHPALLIVDELAHSNAPGSRHPKRYQDVEEVLRAGIDVWTALNIQHLESLSDVVSRITNVTVRETVPDTVIEKADEVVVVDITPDELVNRLREGRVYLPNNARRAADGFFKLGNLTALRELALRRTAERVDDQMVDHLRRNAIEGAWPTAERLLVCVGPDPASEAVVRAASRLATGLHASWIAVTLERPGHETTDAAAMSRIDATLGLAERLGAETARLAGRDLPDEILRFARRENITQIVIGRSHAGAWDWMRGLSLSGVLLRRASDVAIHVITGGELPPRAGWRWPRLNQLLLGLAAATGAVAAAVVAGLVATRFMALPDVSIIFLTAVLVCAVSRGTRAAIVTAMLSFLAYNFFFIPPVYSFTVAEPHEVLALIIFLMVAVLTGGLAGRVREQSDAARRRIATIQSLYDLSRKLAETSKLDDVLWVIVRQAAQAIAGSAIILLPAEELRAAGDLAIRAAFPPEDTLAPAEWAAARWAHAKAEPAGWRTATLPNAQFRYLPIRTARGVVGVVAIKPEGPARELSNEEERTLAALLEQGAVAIERAMLAADARQSEMVAERERLQATLLSSLSHDLRTPLAVTLGAVTSLRGFGSRMEEADRSDLLATIEEETTRLTRFVANLLDMTRVESGIDLRSGEVDLPEVLAGAVARARKAFPSRRIEVAVPESLPLIEGHPVLFEQVIFNLLDNADRYSAPGTPTRLAAAALDGAVTVTIEDAGRGIAPADLARVFDKFTRIDPGDGRPAGTGLGLAIAKGVVDSIGGTIRAESPASGERGTRLVIRLPAVLKEAPRLAPETQDPSW